MFGALRSRSTVVASTSKLVSHGLSLSCHVRPSSSPSLASAHGLTTASSSNSRQLSSIFINRRLCAPPRPPVCTCSGPTVIARRSLHHRSTFNKPTNDTSLYSLLTKRSFFTTTRINGPRSYYYNRGSGNGGAGRGSSGGNSSYSSFRQRIDRLPNNVVLFAIMGLNIAVFLSWQYGKSLLVQFRDPSWLKFLTENFTVSWRNVQSGRLWTVLTCCFSHEGTSHILMNLLSLFFVAPTVMSVLGNFGFLSLYLFSGMISSCVSLLASKLSHSSPFYQSHGASGAVYGTLACFATMFPTTTFLLFFVVPVPAWLCVGGIFAWDLYGSLRRRGGTTDSAGHVGGILAGVAWALRRAGRF
ncbi:hypothetical protein ACM66B_005743 [Microbotryomycetes sp. NB124-2]